MSVPSGRARCRPLSTWVFRHESAGTWKFEKLADLHFPDCVLIFCLYSYTLAASCSLASRSAHDCTRRWVAALTETNMRPVFGEKAWVGGGEGDAKASERGAEGTRFLVAHEEAAAAAPTDENADPNAPGGALGAPLGFVQYRFSVTEDVAVLRVHELQVVDRAQRKVGCLFRAAPPYAPLCPHCNNAQTPPMHHTIRDATLQPHCIACMGPPPRGGVVAVEPPCRKRLFAALANNSG